LFKSDIQLHNDPRAGIGLPAAEVSAGLERRAGGDELKGIFASILEKSERWKLQVTNPSQHPIGKIG
jgi:hypothetical protein